MIAATEAKTKNANACSPAIATYNAGVRRADLEQSCKDWVAWSDLCDGVQRLRAWFKGAAYERHRHDTYAIGLTDRGVQSFWYRGGVHSGTPGDVIVLHPDEAHDGYAGTADGFGYRLAYIEPARVREACRAITGRACALPFVADPVVKSRKLRQALEAAFADELAATAADAFILRIAEALLAESGGPAPTMLRLDKAAVERARQFIESETPRLVHSSDLEAASGLSRFELARQFRALVGTSPYRYSLMRRLEWTRARLGRMSTVDVALAAGFSDQPHFSRTFKAAFGLSPARYARLASAAL